MILTPAWGTTYASVQTVTLVADVDMQKLRGLGDPSLSMDRVEFLHQKIDVDEDFAVVCTDSAPPYTCDWDIDFDDNGVHRWLVSVVTSDFKLFGADATEIRVEIPRTLPTPDGGPSDLTCEGQECVCEHFGSACTWSEPLDYDAEATGHPSNPPDSTSAEINDGRAWSATFNPLVSVGAVDGHVDMDMPSGTPPRFVQRMDAVARDGDNDFIVTETPYTLSVGQMRCYRFYTRQVASYPDFAPDGRFKLFQFIDGDGGLHQVQIDHTDGPSGIDIGDGGICQTIDSIDFEHGGKDSWARFETCIEAPDANTLIHRIKGTLIDSDESGERTCPAYAVSNLDVAAINPLHLFVQTDSNASLVGPARYVTHAISVELPIDRSFWIGPACEVEGTADHGVECPTRFNP